jgi:type VI secretion system protein ImpJ
MFLAPQHFQAQRRHFEEGLALALDALFPFAYGVTSAGLDADALANGTLALQQARGILPDGTTFLAPEGDTVAPVSLGERFSPTRDAHVVHLALPAWRGDAANVDDPQLGDAWPAFGESGNGHHERRYVATSRDVVDETAGQDVATIRFATKRLRLLLDDEVTVADVSLPIARVRRDGAGRFIVDPDFIPPCLHIAASDRLMGMLRGIVGMLEAKGAALAATMAPVAPTAAGATSGASAYAGNELATRWLLHAVRSAEGPLRHLLAARRVHPERLWLELSRLAGALCTFSLTTQPRDLPIYAHDDLGTCFAALERHVRAHLDVVVASRAVVVPLSRSTDVLFVGAIADPRCFQPGARWFLGFRSAVGAAETLARVPQLTKVCASKFVLELVRRAYPGLTVEHVPSPPPGLAPRTDLAYFELTLSGPCATGLTDTREIGVYVPDGLPDPYIELAVLIPA